MILIPLNDSEAELVLESLNKNLTGKEEALRFLRKVPGHESFTERDFGIPQLHDLIDRVADAPEADDDLVARVIRERM